MSLFGALFSGVSGLNAQGSSIAIISDNISNINTVGYKATEATFSTLVTNTGSTSSFSAGGVQVDSRQVVDQQGLVQGSGVGTDLAITGNGLFVVNTNSDAANGEYLYTRAGSFRGDERGYFKNSSGFFLLAWPLDSEGRLPGETGNLNTTSNALVDSLEAVNIRSLGGVATATTSVDVGVNLNAGQAIYEGAGDTIDIISTSAENSANGSDDILIPNSNMEQGDSLRITAGGVTFDFTLGGISKGYNISNGIYGSTSATSVFSELVAGDAFTITTLSSGTVSLTYTPTSPTAALGQFNSLSNLATAIDEYVGITARVSGGRLYVAPENATEAISFAKSGAAMGISNDLASSSAFGASLAATVFSGSVTDGDGITLEAFYLGQSNDLATTNAFGNIALAATDFSTGSSPPTAGDGLRINLSTGTSVTFTFVAGVPVAANGEFDSLATLITAINTDANFSAAAGAAEDMIITPASGRITSIENINASGTSNFATELGLIDPRIVSENYIFDAAAPVAANSEFNSMDTLITAINTASSYFTAAAGSGENMTISPVYGSITNIADYNAIGTSSFATNLGLRDANIIRALGLEDISAGSNRFATLGGLADLVNDSDGISANLANPLDNSTLLLRTDDPLGTISFANVDSTGALTSDFLTEFGIAAGPFGPSYDPQGSSASNMASGDITAHFSRNVRVFDSLGTGHDFQISFLKTAANTWSAEIYAIDPDEIVSTRTDGLVASGTVVFNGDGTLRSASSALTSAITMSWSNGALPNEVSFNLGTAGQPSGTSGATVIGLADGLRQFDSEYRVEFIDQNGVASGLLTGISIDREGFVIANFSNGETRNIYKIPIAEFANPNGLRSRSGNVYSETQNSGDLNLREAGSGGIGTISPGSLETANVDISTELTKMIIAQKGYQSSAKVITTANELLEELNRAF